ncbi:MAG: 4-(cytidine 5'-diphospho)-2-C-methyl-D-erythritol kinase [Ruminococcus sp.]|nr:4-(cytidine 5'-diphospho)-2-C-methyl-D-erythritol kinase [Ruminococcus sp.]
MKLKSAAKINLSLDVTGKLENGYHTIESFFQTVGIYDIIDIKLTEGNEIKLTCSKPYIPCNEKNIAYKAVLLFKESYGKDFGCKIDIRKNIPSQAGMGGGSSDGAAVLFALNKLLETNYSFEKMVEIGAKLGADVPFFLMGGTAYAEGIGEKLKKAPDYSGRLMLIAKGHEGVSTAEAYRVIDSLENPQHPQTEKLAQALENGGDDAYKYFGNLFEYACNLETVRKIKTLMSENGAKNPIMTGSGSAVFGLFDNDSDAIKCCDILRAEGYYAKICRTVKKSFEIL